jgi:L-aspartate oxidase
MIEQHLDHVWLDATGLEQFGTRFPTIDADLVAIGLDPARDWLPVAPAAHHQCGGVVTDLDGATSLPGLWAAGEISCTGVHGANRLASNSLLEGMVFGARVVEAIDAGVDGPSSTGAMRAVLDRDPRALAEGYDDVIGGRVLPRPEELAPTDDANAEPGRTTTSEADVAADRRQLQRVMTVEAGVLRNAGSVERARKEVASILASNPPSRDPATCELRNLAEVGSVLLAAAAARTESRGAHSRTDFPDRDPDQRVRLVFR